MMASTRAFASILVAMLAHSGNAFAPQHLSHAGRIVISGCMDRPSALSASGKGFGEEAPPKQAPKPSVSQTDEGNSARVDISDPLPPLNTGSTRLKVLRRQEQQKRDDEIRKVRDLRSVDATLREDPGAAAIPEKVASRMGKRMLPFVGIPLFGSMATFVGFWYMATYKNMEFQPAIVATSTFVFLGIGLVGITYSVMSASWDDDIEGSGLGVEEFQKNLGNIKDGMARSKENLILREQMAGLSEAEILRAIDEAEKRSKELD